jgi:hypothetical protein
VVAVQFDDERADPKGDGESPVTMIMPSKLIRSSSSRRI